MKLLNWIKNLFRKDKLTSRSLDMEKDSTVLLDLINKKHVIIVHDVKENEDGSAIIDLEANDEMQELIRRYYRTEKFTEELLCRFVTEGLTNYLDTRMG